MTASVVVSESRNAVHNFDEFGNEVHIGDILSRVYQGEQVQRHEFHSLDPRAKKKVFRLGPTTTQFKFVDHTAAIRPFLESGYHITRSVPIRGGLQVWTELQPVEPVPYPDFVDWDAQFWAGSDQVRGHDLNETVVIVSATRPKKAITYRRGWFRQICTNGMVAEILGLGSLRLSHTAFSTEKVRLFQATTSPRITELGEDVARIRGPYVGTRKGAERFADLIQNHLLPGVNPATVRDEDDDVDDEDIFSGPELENIPIFVRDAVKPIARQPRWYLMDLALQFRAMAENKADDRVYAFDVVNALTNPITRVPAQRSNVRPLWNQQPLSKSAMQLLGGMSLS